MDTTWIRRSARLAAKAGKAPPMDSPLSIEREKLDRLYHTLDGKVSWIRWNLDKTHYKGSWEWESAFEMNPIVQEWREVQRLRLENMRK